MDDGSIDLRDQRGRLTRLVIAAVIGLAVTVAVMLAITSGTRGPNSDPVGSSAVPLLAIGIFVTTTAFLTGVLARFANRSR